jgi:hypothetical protein
MKLLSILRAARAFTLVIWRFLELRIAKLEGREPRELPAKRT